jgi:hypothetical protein
MRKIDHFVAGASYASGERQGDVFDPNNGGVQARVGFGTAADLDRAVAAAREAFPAWAATNPQRRARVMFKFKELVEANMDDLALLLASEHGKVIADARGDVQRGLEVIEFACGIPHALKGEYTQGAGPGIDVYSMRQPLGIVAGITPFNFPAMIPMWMFGVAIACGNAFILKPSERDPSVPVRLAELMKEAGLPDGILQVVHGDKEMVDAILDHEEIKAISFVGSSTSPNISMRAAPRTGSASRLRRRQESRHRHARRRSRQVVNDHRRRLRLGRRALHGAAGRRAGRRQDRRCAAREADPGDRGPARRRLDRRRSPLRAGGERRAQGADRKLHPDVRRRGRRAGRRRPRLQPAGP